LDLAPEELTQNVVVVGDPDRVSLLADEFLYKLKAGRCHRGFRSITGLDCETGMPVSIVSTGIGAPSTEIVLNELAALNEIDFNTMQRKESFEPLTIIRVGTSGGLNPATPVGSLALSDYVIGLDNTWLFYDVPSPILSAHFWRIGPGRRLAEQRIRRRSFAGRLSPMQPVQTGK
jgi:uridine phosphorylase